MEGTDVNLSSDTSASYEITLVVEATSNMVCHWDVIKKLYISPALQHFHKKCIPPDGFLSTAAGNCYGLVLFHAADRTPDSVTECFPPTTDIHTFNKMLDDIEFVGGGGEHHSYIAEGLATVLQLFEDVSLLQQNDNVKKYCFLVCNTPSYELPCIESLQYSGLNCLALAEKLKEKEVNLSVICPRPISQLQQLYVTASDAEQPLMNYGQDRRHLVLISGFNLQTEKEPVPVTSEGTAESPVVVSVQNDIPMESTTTMSDTIPSTTNSMSMSSEIFPTTCTQSFAPATQSQGVLTSFGSSNNAGTSSTSNPVTSNPQPVVVQSSVSLNPSQALKNVFTISANTTNASSSVHSIHSSSMIQTNIASSAATVSSNISPAHVSITQPASSAVTINVTAPSVVAKANPPYIKAQHVAQGVLEHVNNQMAASHKILWSGILEWTEKRRPPQDKVTQAINCQMILAPSNTPMPDVNSANWPRKLNMQLVHQSFISQVQQFIKKPHRQLLFKFQQQNLQQLVNVFAQKPILGLIQFNFQPQPQTPESKVIIMLFHKKTSDASKFIGLMPNNPLGLLNALRAVVNKRRADGTLVNAPGQDNTQGGMQQSGIQPTISNSSAVMQPGGSMVINDQGMKMQQYRTGVHIQRQQQPQQTPQQFHPQRFQGSDIGITSNPQSMISVNQPQQQVMNQQVTHVMNPGNIQTINVSRPMQQNPMNIRTQSLTMGHGPMSDGSKILGGMRGVSTTTGNMQIPSNISTGQVNMSNSQSGISVPQRVMPGTNNRAGLVRMQQIRPISMPGNRPVTQESTQLLSLLGSNNNTMQPGTMNIRQPDNVGLRQPTPNTMQQQNFIRGNNILQSMPNQRRY